MAVTLSQISNTQAFGVWLTRTNQILTVMSANVVTTDTTTTGATTSGNAVVSNFLGANTLSAVYLKGSNGALGNTQTLTILSNVSINSTAYIGNSSANTYIGYNPSANASYYSNGNINSYLQTIIQNANGGGNATVDLIINADTATDTSNYLDIGINSSGYTNSQFSINGALDAYFYSANGSLAIGTASAKPLQFFANGTLSTNEAMRIDAGANVGIGNTAPNAKLQVTGTANISGNVVLSSNLTVIGTANINASNVVTNQNIGGFLNVVGAISTNTNVFVGNSVVNATINSTFFTATSNNANFLGGTAAASYQLNSTLAANVATLTANNTSFVGSVTAANVVSNTQLQANLANYTNTAGLPAVIAVNTANNTSFVGSVAAANVVSNTQLQANIQFFVNTSQLSANLANYTTTAGLSAYQTTAGLNANIASYLPTYTGIVNATALTTTRSSVNTIGIQVTNTGGNVFTANTTGVTILGSTTANVVTILGAANVANNLSVSGTVVVSGDLQVNGQLTYNGTGTASIIPEANNLYSLGNSSLVWSSLYATDGVFYGSVNVASSVVVGGSLSVNGTSLTVNGSIAANSLTVNNSNYFVSSYSVPSQAVPNTNLQTVDFYDTSVYRSAEYLVQIAANTAPGVTNYHTTKILVMHDGVSAYTTEYGSMVTDSSLAIFQADIGTVGVLTGQLRLRATPQNTNVVIKFIRSAMAV